LAGLLCQDEIVGQLCKGGVDSDAETGVFKLSHYRWALIDIDGTLLDFRKAESIALRATPAELGYSVPGSYVIDFHAINDDLWRRFEAGDLSARDVRTQRFKLLFERLGLAGDPHDFSEVYLRNLCKHSTFIDGAEKLLAELKNRIGLVALTNGFADVQHARIARLGLDDAFDHVIISEEVGVAKPDPAVFDIAFKKMGHPAKSSVLMVGDSLSSDIRGGVDYGIDTCWFNPQKIGNTTTIKPKVEIAHLDELANLLIPPR